MEAVISTRTVPADPAYEADAFANALIGCVRPAFLLARSVGLSPDDAAEVVQEASAQAWRYRSGLRGEFRPWFLSIVYRRARRPSRRWLTIPVF